MAGRKLLQILLQVFQCICPSEYTPTPTPCLGQTCTAYEGEPVPQEILYSGEKGCDFLWGVVVCAGLWVWIVRVCGWCWNFFIGVSLACVGLMHASGYAFADAYNGMHT